MERLLPLAVAAACTAVALLVPTSQPDEQATPAPATTTTVPPSVAAASVAVGTVTVHSAGPPMATLPGDVEAEVRRTLEDYLRLGSLEAVAAGRSGAGTAALFTATARTALQGAGRAVLVDDGLGPAHTVRLARADTDLVALAGPAGEVGAVVASIDWRVTGRTAGGGRITVARTGELTLVPDGDRWRIDAFELTAEQDRTAPTTTTVPGAHGDGSPGAGGR